MVVEDIALTGGNANTKVAFRNCALFETFSIEINGTLVGEVNFINITMPMYNFIEYSDNYSDTSGSLGKFKRDEIDTNSNVCNANISSFKYQSIHTDDVAVDGVDGVNGKKKVKIAVSLKYLSNFWRSLRNASD